MYRKDLITAEIQKLSAVLARIMGLKLEGKLEDAKVIFDETMEKSFHLSTDLINGNDFSAFENWITLSDLAPEKLDLLSEFLYYELGLSEARNKAIAPKLNLVYQFLADKHKIVHLVNLHRQKTIQQYL